jgi:hypothetical protein
VKASGYSSARKFATSVEQQLLNTDDYSYRYDFETRLASGCDFGGTMAYRQVSAGTRVDLVKRTLTRGLPMTGSAVLGDDGSFVLSIKIGGRSLHFERNAGGKVTVNGSFRGKPAR